MRARLPSNPLAAALSLALSLVCTGCPDIAFKEQEIRLRHAAADDALELCVITQGLEHVEPPSTGGRAALASQPERLEEALELGAEVVERMASGQRTFVLFPFPVDVDLDQWIAREAGDEEHERDDCEQRFLELCAGITVSGAGSFLDDQQRLAVWQTVRVPQIARLVELCNTCMNAEYEDKITRSAGSERSARIAYVRDDLEFLDEQSAELWLAHVESGRPWVVFDAGKIVVDVPVTRTVLERILGELLGGGEQRAERVEGDWVPIVVAVSHVLSHIEELAYSEAGARLTIAPLERNAIVLRSGELAGAWDSRLLETLRARGLRTAEMDLEQLRERFTRPLAAPDER